MIAISDKLEGFMEKQSTQTPVNSGITMSTGAGQDTINPEVQHTMGPPVPPGPGRVAPQPQAAAMADSSEPTIDFPPPPPSASSGKKRLGLFK